MCIVCCQRTEIKAVYNPRQWHGDPEEQDRVSIIIYLCFYYIPELCHGDFRHIANISVK